MIPTNQTLAEGIVHFDICVNNQNLDGFVNDVIKYIRKDWDGKSFEKKFLEGGTSNKLIALHCPTALEEKMDFLKSDIILVRIYGNNTDMIIDRRQEIWNYLELSTNQLASSLYCTFNNGYCYQFINGDVITPLDLKDKHILKLTARLVARIHSIELSSRYVSAYKMEGTVFHTLEKYFDLLPERFEQSDMQKRFEESGLSIQQLRNEAVQLKDIINKTEPPQEVAFCHNDLNCPNLILDKTGGEIFCIDHEFAGPNFTAYDIGNFFNEFPGNTNIDFSLYPTKETQMEWLKAYVEEKHNRQGTARNVEDEGLQKLYKQVNKFALVSHLLWGVWALIQAHHSDIDFDFIGYSSIRFTEYFRRKNDFLVIDDVDINIT